MQDASRNNWSLRERRLFHRMEARYPVKVDLKEDFFDTDIYLRDFSAGGVKIITRSRLDKGKDIDLWVQVPDGHGPMHFAGRVAWLKKVGNDVWDAGICFKHIRLAACLRLFNGRAAA